MMIERKFKYLYFHKRFTKAFFTSILYILGYLIFLTIFHFTFISSLETQYQYFLVLVLLIINLLSHYNFLKYYILSYRITESYIHLKTSYFWKEKEFEIKLREFSITKYPEKSKRFKIYTFIRKFRFITISSSRWGWTKEDLIEFYDTINVIKGKEKLNSTLS
jgi:hypothetical protein